jgi:pyruvate dehydrogenase E2 component (dihydrolipoamide acetyltransferase)/2-oxoisovalerate dehydrogenase E2 component (dihydrolipoyl transacylase)
MLMDFRVPDLGEGIYEAELVRWLVKSGDAVKRGQPLMEVMTDKATMEVPTPFTGKITAIHGQPGQTIKVGSLMLTYEPVGGEAMAPATAKPARKGAKAKVEPAAVATPTPPANTERAPAGGNGPGMVKAAPSVRLLARKLGLDLQTVRGSGPAGRILLDDLTSFVRQPQAAADKVDKAPPQFDLGKPGTRIKLQGLRRLISEHMVRAKHTIPHYSYVDECDVTELVRLRAALRDTYQHAGIRLTYMAFVVKAVVAALKEVPLVNSSLDDQTGEIVLHDQYNVGVAVAAPGGLIVPVIHHADRLDLGQLAREIEHKSEEARTGKAKREDLKGGTFTVTSIGNLGGLISTPIINHPEVAILGIGKIVRRPTYDAAGNIRPSDLMYLSFSFDHRVVDGAIGVVFGNAVMKRLTNPATMLVGVLDS